MTRDRPCPVRACPRSKKLVGAPRRTAAVDKQFHVLTNTWSHPLVIERLGCCGYNVIMKDSLVRARIDEDLKEQATDVLKQNGLEMSDAIRLFLIQVVRRGGLPFSVHSKRRVPASRRRKSRLANEMDLDLLNEHRALSPTERLNAFLTHSRQMAQLQAAGEALRPSQA